MPEAGAAMHCHHRSLDRPVEQVEMELGGAERSPQGPAEAELATW